jgi:Holliday junction resolvase RusA-like endonuclease
MEPIRLTITGQPPRKSNNRRIVTNRRTRRPMLVKSRDALAWMESAQLQIPASVKVRAGSADQALAITFWVRYASRRPDLSVELILDTLQKAGVISDDRYVFETHAFKEIDRDNPGVDILIEESEL